MVLQGEGALQNRRYVVRRIQWPLATPTVRPHTYGEESFTALKVEVYRKRLLKLAREACISKATWYLVDQRTALHRAGRESTREEHSARREYYFIIL